jgi:hypothetical protein
VDTRLDKNQTKLGVDILSVALKMTSDVDSLLDQVVKILRKTRSKTSDTKDTEDLGTSDGLDLGDTLGITKKDTDLRRSHTLLSVLEDVFFDLLGLVLAPRRRRPTVRKRGAGNTLTTLQLQDDLRINRVNNMFYHNNLQVACFRDLCMGARCEYRMLVYVRFVFVCFPRRSVWREGEEEEEAGSGNGNGGG